MDNWPIGEDLEIGKNRFLKLVEQLSQLRDLQYGTELAPSIVRRAERVLAINLPSNFLRAAAIFVDHAHGFPPKRCSFEAPAWVTAKMQLPDEAKGSLACAGFQEISALGEGDCVVLLGDIPEHGLHAGMAGIIKEISANPKAGEVFLLEFGDVDDSVSFQVEVPVTQLRSPRPGDFLESYR